MTKADSKYEDATPCVIGLKENPVGHCKAHAEGNLKEKDNSSLETVAGDIAPLKDTDLN